MKSVYIVAGKRSAVGKANKGGFRFFRPDDLAAQVIKALLKEVPNVDKEEIDDVIVGNAMPEAEQGLNVGRLISLMGLDTEKVPGMTVNRYCSSGLETIAIAVSRLSTVVLKTSKMLSFSRWKKVKAKQRQTSLPLKNMPSKRPY